MTVKFYGYGDVWSPGKQCTVASFVGGELITDDSDIIELCRLNKFKEEILESDTNEETDITPEAVAKVAAKNSSRRSN